MLCAHCHTPCSDGEVFCPHCGAALQVAGGTGEGEVSTFAANNVENKAEIPPQPGAPRRLKLGRRGVLAAGAACLLAVVGVAAALLLPREKPGVQAGQMHLISSDTRNRNVEVFYYDGALLVGPEEGITTVNSFLDGASKLVLDQEGYLKGVLNQEGLTELSLPIGNLHTTAYAADGSVLYYATDDGELWRQPLPEGEGERLLEGASFSGSMVLSPSGDALAYEDEEEVWHLVQGTRQEDLPLETGAQVLAVSDGGDYIYYSHAVNGGAHYEYQYDSPLSYMENSVLFCWDGTSSRLIAPSMSSIVISNRTGDQLLLLGQETYLVEGAENFHFAGAVLPVWMYRGVSDLAGVFTKDRVTVIDCADFTSMLFYSTEDHRLCQINNGALRTVEEKVTGSLSDATGETVWYLQDGAIWRLEGSGKPRQVWADAGSYAVLNGVSPEGDAVLYENREGLWLLRQGGSPQWISEKCHGTIPYWAGFYYWKSNQLFFCDWEGNQRELEELSGHTGLSYISGSLPEVEGSDGSIWFLLPQGEAVPFSIGQTETSAEVGRAETSVE